MSKSLDAIWLSLNNFDTLEYGMNLLHIQYGYSMVSLPCLLVLGYFNLVPNFAEYKYWDTLVHGINSLDTLFYGFTKVYVKVRIL